MSNKFETTGGYVLALAAKGTLHIDIHNPPQKPGDEQKRDIPWVSVSCDGFAYKLPLSRRYIAHASQNAEALPISVVADHLNRCLELVHQKVYGL